MRDSHGSWICCFLHVHVSLCLQFAICPLLPEIAMSLHLTRSNTWLTNINQHLQHGGWHSRKIGSRSALWSIWHAHTHYAHVAGRGLPCLCTGLVTNLHG
jgi:hypothetical protein